MEIIKQKRDLQTHIDHINRVKTMTAFIDTSTPSTLGLKHLATRPKKQQLIDDRRQEIAKENKKLMENMAKILSENRMKGNFASTTKLRSINEAQRKNAVEKLNFENRLLFSRLQNIAPMIKREEFQKDYDKHKSFHSRRKKFTPFGINNIAFSPLSKSQKNVTQDNQSDDDADLESDSFLSQYRSMNNMNTQNIQQSSSPLTHQVPQTISEFRRQVISSKKTNNIVVSKQSQSSHSPVQELHTYDRHNENLASKYILSHDPGL